MYYRPVDSITRRNPGGKRRLSEADIEYELFGGLGAAKLRSDNPEIYKEEIRQQNQLELESSLHRETAMRLGVYDSCPSLWVSKTTAAADYYDEDYDYDEPCEYESEDDYVTTSVTPKNRLQLARNKLRLYNVTIFPCIVRGRQGKTVTGTLETHVNGFRYKNYSIPLELDIMFHNVRYAFFLDEDEKIAPLCHLHLCNPIMVGTKMTTDIQFRMEQTSNGRDIRCLVRDSDEVKKEHQKRKDNSEVMRNFLSKVDPICFRSNSFEFTEVKKKYGFYGEIIMKEHLSLRATFVFMFTCLVQLEHMPFSVVILNEIEIVNLVDAGSGMEMFNMTIVFKDFKRDVLQINSIPSTKLIYIKSKLDTADVKYYESQFSKNKLDIPLWRYLLKKITDNPKTFLEKGGWNFLKSGNLMNLEKLFQQDPSGITCYSDIKPGQVSDPRKKNMPLSVTTRTMPVGKRVMASSDESECDLGPKVNEKERKHTARTKLVKTARRRMVMASSDESECGSSPKANEKEIKHATRTKLVKTARRRMVLASSDESELDTSPKVNEKERKHAARTKLFKTARRRMVISDESDGEE